MLTTFEFDIPGRRGSRAKNLLYGILISQLLTTGLGATLPGGMTLTLLTLICLFLCNCLFSNTPNPKQI